MDFVRSLHDVWGEDAFPADFTERTFNAPRIFHGAMKDVRDAWKQVVRQAVKDGDWTVAFRSLEMTSLNSLPGDILFGRTRPSYDLRPNDAIWRLHWICHTKPFIKTALGKKATDGEVYELTRRLIVSGMREAWFTLGLLDLEDPESPRAVWARPGVEREMLEWYVHWSADISAIQSRLATILSPARVMMRTEPFAWIFHVLRYAELAGYNVHWYDVDEVRCVIESHFDGNCADYLVEVGIAEARDGKYHLLPPPAVRPQVRRSPPWPD